MDEQEIMNENNWLEIAPYLQPTTPSIRGVQSEGKARVLVKELAQAIMPHAP